MRDIKKILALALMGPKRLQNFQVDNLVSAFCIAVSPRLAEMTYVASFKSCITVVSSQAEIQISFRRLFFIEKMLSKEKLLHLRTVF